MVTKLGEIPATGETKRGDMSFGVARLDFHFIVIVLVLTYAFEHLEACVTILIYIIYNERHRNL